MNETLEKLFDLAERKAIGRSLTVEIENLLTKYDATVSLFLGAPASIWVNGEEIGIIDLVDGGDPGREFIFKPV